MVCKGVVACVFFSFLISSEKVKEKNFYMPHKSVEGPTFTEAQTSNRKISLTLCFVQCGFKVVEKESDSVPPIH